MSKRKGKKYNPHKTISTMSTYLMKNKAVIYHVALDVAALFDYKTMQPFHPDKYLGHALATARYKWAVASAACFAASKMVKSTWSRNA